MSTIIIPLAGPDFFTEHFGIRPLYRMDNLTIIEHVLTSRSWMPSSLTDTSNHLVFVLRDAGSPTEEMSAFIKSRFPLADIVTLSCLSTGAPLSALAGIALARQHDMPVIVDLADIAFTTQWDPATYFHENPDVDAVVPYFSSTDPEFSYLTLDGLRVIKAREKQVISSNASAGVYCFRDVATYLRAVIYCLQHPDTCKISSAFFVCPSINGLITDERHVHGIEVYNVEPISTFFHAP